MDEEEDDEVVVVGVLIVKVAEFEVEEVLLLLLLEVQLNARIHLISMRVYLRAFVQASSWLNWSRIDASPILS
jgi:hypothetical protein